MHALSVNQPWAQLVVMGIKTVETRSWPYPRKLIGQRIAFHATKRIPVWLKACTPPPMPNVPQPYGAIVGSGVIEACLPIVDAQKLLPADWDLTDCLFVGESHLWRDSNWDVLLDDQRPYGDFTPGRWAWIITDAAPTTERCPQCWGTGAWRDDGDCESCDGEGRCDPIPARGRQRIWTWQL